MFSSGWVALKRLSNDATNWRIAVFFEIFSTDWCVYGMPCWLNVRSSTRSHFPQYVQFMVCCSLNACQLNWYLFFFLAASEDFACSNCYLEILSVTSVHAAFKQIHWSNYVIKVSFSLKACLQTAVTCGNTSFPKKLQSKVSKHAVWCKIIDAFISQDYRDITCRKLWILVEVSSR